MMGAEVLMDRFYNERAAAWARDLVMKMDDGTAREFVTHVTREVLLADIKANQRVVNARVTEINKSLLRDMDRMVSKGVTAPAQVVAEVSKAWEESGVKRDRGGRFATVEQRVRSVRDARLVMDKQKTEAYGIPAPGKLATNGVPKNERGRHHRIQMSNHDLAAYQQQFLQLAEAMDTATAHGGAGVTAILQDRRTGRRHVVNVEGDPAEMKGWDPGRADLVTTRIQGPKGEPGERATFDLISSLSRSDAAGAAAQRGVAGFGGFADRWNTPGEDEAWNTNAGTYRRIGAGSQLLGTVATDPKLKMAAAFGELVGQYGPEAEKVVGPQARKTAYRFRGTERKPDEKLVEERNRRLRMEAQDRNQAPTTLSDTHKSEVSLQTAIDYLDQRKPSLRLSEIHLKSGRVPPSEGVMIGSDGKIKHQAIGHADDHYLPFDLTNLKDLRGGQYVRTRTTGGLTTEDIYTGLVSGARQVTVVSNSGVFTVNFADDFRGVRRYNDKAASMVDRYAKTLDTLKEGKVERHPIDPKTRAQIRDEVTREMSPAMGYKPEEIENAIKARIENFREIPQLTKDEIEHIESRAEQANLSDYDKRQWIASQTDRILEQRRSRLYKLDGEGYSAAMDSLKEQYPYYIQSVEYRHRYGGKNRAGEMADPNHLSERHEKLTTRDDRGYVMPRHNRPEQALEGYYDEQIAGAGSIPGTGKTPAHLTDYQNWEHNKLKGRSGKLVRVNEPEAPAEKVEGEVAAPQAAAKPQSIDQQRKSVQAKLNVEAQSVTHLKSALGAAQAFAYEGNAKYPQLNAAKTNPDSVLSDRAKRSALAKELETVVTDLNGSELSPASPEQKALAERINVPLRAMHAMEHAGGGEIFERKLHLGISPAIPYRFDALGYNDGATRVMAEGLLRPVNEDLKLVGADVPWKSEDDAVLQRSAEKAGHVARLLRAGNTSPEAQADVEEAMAVLGMPDEMGRQAFKQVTENSTEEDRKRLYGVFARVAENIERKRRLLVAAPPPPAAPERARDLPAGDITDIDAALKEAGVSSFRSGGPAT